MEKQNENHSTEATIETDDSAIQDDVYASEEQGKQYRGSVYHDIDYDTLEEAPNTNDYPKTDGKERFRIADVPKVPKLSHIVGPGALMLGAALGSGEMLFWPVLIADSGWTLYWAFWIGVLTNFFINTELQRWTMATGESIFQGFSRLNSVWPWFFLVAGFFHIGWPGWAASGSEVLAAWTGIVPRADWWILGIITMVVIWLSYMAGPVLYNIIEKAQTAMMIVAIIFAVSLVFLVDSVGQLANVPAGAVAIGSIPSGVDLVVLIAALGATGAGGYNNLTQSLWAREKGFGMSSYQGRVKNPIRGADDPEETHGGYTFKPTEANLQRWKAWWRVIQREHFLTFVLGAIIIGTMVMTITAKYVPENSAINPSTAAIDMWINGIIPQVGGLAAFMMYALLVIALFSTQYALTEVFVRNSADIIYEHFGRERGWSLNRLFLGLLTGFVLWGIIIIGLQFQKPWVLLVLGVAVGTAMMWPYNALTIILSVTRLPEHTQPGWGRVVAMWWATGLLGYASILLIGQTAVTYLGLNSFATAVYVMGSGVGGYLLWLLLLTVQVYTMYRTARAKLDADETVDSADEASGFFA
jgi:hypothetical protein